MNNKKELEQMKTHFEITNHLQVVHFIEHYLSEKRKWISGVTNVL